MNELINQLFQDMQRSIRDEVSRDHWLACCAAQKIGERNTPECVETEPLEALHTWIGQVLLDRAVTKDPALQALF